MEPRIGDRYKLHERWNKDGKDFVLEMINDRGRPHKLVLNEGNRHGFEVGKIDDWGDIHLMPNDWEYMGNFSKSQEAKDFWDKIK